METSEEVNQIETEKPGSSSACADAPEEELSQEALPEFPKEAWMGLFKDYKDLVGGSTEAPDEYHWVVFLTIVGLILGRNVYLTNPHPLYPNFFSALIGPTGISRKSTALRFGEQLLAKMGSEVEILHGVVSSEGIYQRLSHKDGTYLLIYSDEFRSLIQVAKRSGTSDIIPKLNSLYGCPEVDSVDRRSDPIKVNRPFVSLITGSPLGWLENAFGTEEVVGGFLNRFLFVVGTEKPPIPFPMPPDDAKWAAFLEKLNQAVESWKEKPLSMGWTEEAMKLYKEFYQNWHRRQKTLLDDIAALTNRMPDHIVKIAMVYSALEGRKNIAADSIAAAIAVGNYLEQITHSLFGDVTLTSAGRVENMIINRLRGNQGAMEFRKLRQSLGGKVDSESFNRSIANLQKADVIKILQPGTAGVTKKTVFLLGG